MEGNFPTSKYNRKSSIVVKNKYDGSLLRSSSSLNPRKSLGFKPKISNLKTAIVWFTLTAQLMVIGLFSNGCTWKLPSFPIDPPNVCTFRRPCMTVK